MKNTYLKNKNENDLQEILCQDAEIPAVVHDKVNKAYRIIESRKIVQKPAPADPFRWMKTGGKIAGGLAAVLAVGFIICVSDPVMARELPLVGSLLKSFRTTSASSETLRITPPFLKSRKRRRQERQLRKKLLLRKHLPRKIIFIQKPATA